jgi:pimeloyl-ACP methyl ester carboxylesterase
METFCLVHGAWHDDACWELLVAELTRRGHECLTPVLPLENPAATFADYAEVVVGCIGSREDAVLVGHSMASAVTALVTPRRPVKLLVYLCPMMYGFPSAPDAPPRVRRGYSRPPIDEEGRSWWPRERAVSQLYGRLDRRVAERLARRLRPQPQGPFIAPYPLERPPEVPSAFIYAREDEFFDSAWSRWIAPTLLGVTAIEVPGGHFPMLEHPAVLADLLEEVSVAAWHPDRQPVKRGAPSPRDP